MSKKGNSKKKIAVCPGSFDPITYGHLDIIRRARHVFDEVYIAVLNNSNKKGLFTIDERLSLIEQSLDGDMDGIFVESFQGLLVDYCKQVDAHVIVRGLRAVSDFEYEMQLTSMNKALAPNIDTFYIQARNEYSFVSSSVVKDVVKHGGQASDFVPDIVANALSQKFNQ